MIKMDKDKRLKELRELKQKYIYLRNLFIKLNNQKQNTNSKVKKLVLTKPLYGKNLTVG